MADVHPIRLRGPWQYEVLERFLGDGREREASEVGNPPAPGKVRMPCDWGESLGRAFRGRVRYVRAFNCPTALEPHETVFLVLEAIDAQGVIQLNGERLGEATLAGCPARFDITRLLKPRNELAVEVSLPKLSASEEETRRGARSGQAGGLCGEVRLEISGGG